MKRTHDFQLPRVAIVGRPNVGKSTLFNLLIGKRKSVVKNEPGVTRDVLIDRCELWGKWFEIIDTGGLTRSQKSLDMSILDQVQNVLKTVDFAIMVTDGREGLTSDDEEVFRLLKTTGVPFFVLVNKVDHLSSRDLAKSDFYKFGDQIFAVSLESRLGVSEFLEFLYQQLPSVSEEDVLPTLKVALVGKPNVGKSSLVNALLGEKRVIVSETPGTTVDVVEIPFFIGDRPFCLIDTAGLRRSSRRKEDVEIVASFKTQEAIAQADILLLVIDCGVGPTEQDATILQKILEEHKMVIVVANKSDVAKAQDSHFREKFRTAVAQVFHFYPDIPVVFTSAHTKMGLSDLKEKILWAQEQLSVRIATSELNDFLFDTIRKAPSPVWGNVNVKFYYMTQTKQVPPSFIAFCNHPEGVDQAYRRFLVNQIKEKFNLKGVPVRVYVMKSRSE
ncbi:MAG: ribosome biogenesis GTPase Der [Bdellovibrionaceae bacterium]|nr:ribosome biogenesis GTPase Der [Pseudobdellovibrionaceae bacterium]MDW8189603.1 ribosome biogenesis GTPase Der [Pseudobdellovibrionaceae bacterium]